MHGVERADVGLHNWRERPYSAWSFQNVSEIIPSAVIAAGKTGAPPPMPSPVGLADHKFDLDGRSETIEEFLERSETDSFMVCKAGRTLLEWHAPHATPDRPHIVFSISKSITGLLAGILQDRGQFDPARTVAHYLPAAAVSGFGDCVLQHILDMRVSLEFTEDYLDKTGDYARYRRATGWNPATPGDTAEGLEGFLFSLNKGAGPHGGDFRYLSPNSDLLGILFERITGAGFADLMSELLWQPLGAARDAEMTLDPFGAPRSAGGISVTVHDLARLGQLIANDGALSGKQVVPARWVDDMRRNGDPEAWARGDFADLMPPGSRYRNKWYQVGPSGRQVAAVGIHGQWLFVDSDRELVIARTSSQALPLDEPLDHQSLELFAQIADGIA